MSKLQRSAIVVLSLALSACGGTEETLNVANTGIESAAVTGVTLSGGPGNYTFQVTVESPDTGCTQYADWWEVVGSDGRLVYRRILAHSHVDEQPFTRSGGPVNVAPSEEIAVRVHMNNSGYSEQVFSGSIEQGLISATVDESFSADLASIGPLPDSCAF